MKIAIACDPNGNSLKVKLIENIQGMGHQVVDFGSDDPIYANAIISLAESVSSGGSESGIVICGTGIGASIAANKVLGAHCALVSDGYQAARASLSNNANIIALGAQLTTPFQAIRFVQIWLDSMAGFDPAGRSAPKINRIVEYERQQCLMKKDAIIRK